MSECFLCVVLYQNHDIGDLVCGKGAADKAPFGEKLGTKTLCLE